MEGAELRRIADEVKGVAAVCGSLAVSSREGVHKYAGCEMALLCAVLDGVVGELEAIARAGRVPEAR